MMSLPALVIACGLFWVASGIRQLHSHFDPNSGSPVELIGAVDSALAGRRPTGIHELHVQVNDWQDHIVSAYFCCDPESLRNILEKPPFVRQEGQVKFYFAHMTFADLEPRRDVPGCIVFRRTDLDPAEGEGSVCTDANFSFASVHYALSFGKAKAAPTEKHDEGAAPP